MRAPSICRKREAGGRSRGDAADLTSVPLCDLVAELRRRGWQEGEEAKAAAIAHAEERGREMWPLIRQLGSLAGEALPEALAEAQKLAADNASLRARAHEAELNASRVVCGLVEMTFPQTRHTLDHDNDND